MAPPYLAAPFSKVSLQREETERGGIQAVNFATVTADAVVMTLVTVTMTESPS